MSVVKWLSQSKADFRIRFAWLRATSGDYINRSVENLSKHNLMQEGANLRGRQFAQKNNALAGKW